MARALLDADRGELESWIESAGFPRFHARQVDRAVFKNRCASFEDMTELPLALRAKLSECWSVFSLEMERRHTSRDGTHKLAFGCGNGWRIETVLLSEASRRTVCLSSQVGCGMGCVFCASGLNGLQRNLTKGEIVEQVLRCQQLLPEGEKITHLVVMGMGESLANLENVVAALDRICSADGLGLSQRRVTISTVGLPGRIEQLASLRRQFHLAVSLHAATPAKRDELVPINRQVGLEAVLEASDAYFRATGRQVTFEYVLLGNVNDGPEDSRALGVLVGDRNAHVNLIPYNPVEGLPFIRPRPERVREFARHLRSRGVSVTVRKTKGVDIDAACGQLRRRIEAEADPTRPDWRRLATNKNSS